MLGLLVEPGALLNMTLIDFKWNDQKSILLLAQGIKGEFHM